MCFNTDSGGAEVLGQERRGPSLVSKIAAGLVAAIVIIGAVLIPCADLIIGSKPFESLPAFTENVAIESKVFTFAEAETIIDVVREDYEERMLHFHEVIADKTAKIAEAHNRIRFLEEEIVWLDEESDSDSDCYLDDNVDDSWVDDLEEEPTYIEDEDLPSYGEENLNQGNRAAYETEAWLLPAHADYGPRGLTIGGWPSAEGSEDSDSGPGYSNVHFRQPSPAFYGAEEEGYLP